MFEEEKDANTEQETSTVQDEVSESSTEEPQESEATEEQAIEEVQTVPYDRFKEVNDEKKELREALLKTQQQIFELTKPKKEQSEESLGSTPEEREFWDLVDKRGAKNTKKLLDEREKVYEARINALTNEYGKIVSRQFLKDNPDVKRGSQELKDILVLAQTKGLELDEAKKIVLYDKMKSETVSKKKEVIKKKNEDKIDANQESSDVSTDSVIQPTKKESVADFITRQMSKTG